MPIGEFPHLDAAPEHAVSPIGERGGVRFEPRSGSDVIAGDEDFVEAFLGGQRADAGETGGEVFARGGLFRAVARAGDEVQREEAAGRERALQVAEPVRVAGLGAEDVLVAGEVEVVEDHVEAALVLFHPRVGIGDDDLRARFREVHFLFREVDQLRVEVDAGEGNFRQKVAQCAECGATRDAEHENGGGLSRGSQYGCGGQQIPCEAGQETLLVIGGMDRPRHAELGGER